MNWDAGEFKVCCAPEDNEEQLWDYQHTRPLWMVRACNPRTRCHLCLKSPTWLPCSALQGQSKDISEQVYLWSFMVSWKWEVQRCIGADMTTTGVAPIVRRPQSFWGSSTFDWQQLTFALWAHPLEAHSSASEFESFNSVKTNYDSRLRGDWVWASITLATTARL
jgi:hypothetical protein